MKGALIRVSGRKGVKQPSNILSNPALYPLSAIAITQVMAIACKKLIVQISAQLTPPVGKSHFFPNLRLDIPTICFL